MRPLTRILFVLFYVCSSYAITQTRTSDFLTEFDHVVSRAGKTQIHESCRQFASGYPNYRQAKPKPVHHDSSNYGEIARLHIQSAAAFTAPTTISARSTFDADPLFSRPPPSLRIQDNS